HGEADEVVGGDAEVLISEVPERAHEKGSAGQEQQGERHLAGDENLAEANMARTGGDVGGLVLQSLGEGRASHAPGRYETKEKAGEEGNADSKQQYGAVHPGDEAKDASLIHDGTSQQVHQPDAQNKTKPT